MQKEKKWSIIVLITYGVLMAGIALLVVIADPYFHYHKPVNGVSYQFNEPVYMNDGIARNFDYNALIIGTSTTQGFSTAEAEKLFGYQFVRITYMGEGFKRINDTLMTALEYNADLEMVIRGVDAEWFLTDENWVGYSEYPEYLFDRSIWNDTSYLFNKEIFFKSVLPEMIHTVKHIPAQTLDDGVNFYGATSVNNVLDKYERPEREEKVIEESETKDYFNILKRNLDKNVLSTIQENQDITFYIFIPPYSICWWDSLHQHGDAVVKRRIEMEQYAIEQLLENKNVKLFSFNNNFELICNLNNYCDEVHYGPKVNSQILEWMRNGNYELTKENYRNYISEITEFYCHYDYDSLLNTK